ncbi:MAG TPA: FHA domain-containing protein [Acidimicrobiales bacterium]|nr:FHA domain-containing protein [Acidimicrobiales bacterium]
MADVFCNKCGHGNPLGSNFCSSCGAPLSGEEVEPTTITFKIDDSIHDTEHDVAVDHFEIPSGTGALVVKRGPNAGSRYLLDTPVTTAGRHPDSEIFLDDVTVSRRHAEVRHTDDGYVVNDAGSLNGTYLNRERIEGEMPLANGDELQIGTFRLVFMLGGSA